MSREIVAMPLCKCREGRIMICENHGETRLSPNLYIYTFTHTRARARRAHTHTHAEGSFAPASLINLRYRMRRSKRGEVICL